MKLFIAASYARKADAKRLAAQLAGAGHIIVARWLDAYDGDNTYVHADEVMRKSSGMDAEDVAAADGLVMLNGDTPELRSRGGKHTEFGMALAMEKKVFVYGPREGVHEWNPNVTVCPSFTSLLIALGVPEATVSHVCGLQGFGRSLDDVCPACRAPDQDTTGIPPASPSIRTFATGATRDTDAGKLDYEGFFSPLVLECYATYMNAHRTQSNGDIRPSDNWQKGIPKEAYIKSEWRHFMDVWKLHRGYPAKDTLENAACAQMFNIMGYLHEYLKEKLAASTPDNSPHYTKAV